MKNWDTIIVNGDSYSALSPRHRVYSEFMQEQLDLVCDNVARQGSNNDRILRSTIEAVLHHLAQGHRPLLILGLSYIMRQEVWVGDVESDTLDITPDTVRSIWNRMLEPYPQVNHHSQTLPVVSLDWVANESRWKQQFRHQVEYEFYIHKRVLDTYVNLFTLTEFLHRRGVPYIVFSAASNQDCAVETFPAIQHLASVKSVMADPHVIELHTNCVRLWAQSNDPDCDPRTGHLSEQGHRLWAQRMIRLIGEHHGS